MKSLLLSFIVILISAGTAKAETTHCEFIDSSVGSKSVSFDIISDNANKRILGQFEVSVYAGSSGELLAAMIKDLESKVTAMASTLEKKSVYLRFESPKILGVLRCSSRS